MGAIVFQDNILSQLAFEEATRERLLHWDKQLSRITFIVEEVGGVRLLDHISRLVKTVLSSMTSPLGTSYCSRTWTVMVHGVIGQWGLGEFDILTLTQLRLFY